MKLFSTNNMEITVKAFSFNLPSVTLACHIDNFVIDFSYCDNLLVETAISI